MSHKNVFTAIQNRVKALKETCFELRGVPGNNLRGSAFKETQVDLESESLPIKFEDNQLFQLKKKVEELERRVKQLEKGGQEMRKKKRRRKAQQISRCFNCEFQGCDRIYGSETSLKNHIKIKHA